MRTHKTITSFMPTQHEQQILKCDICGDEVIKSTDDIGLQVDFKVSGWCSIDSWDERAIDICPVCADKYTVNECLCLIKTF